jgi:hypothetical protein
MDAVLIFSLVVELVTTASTEPAVVATSSTTG